MILGVYSTFPILRTWLKAAQEKEILYFLMLWLIIAGIMPLLEYVLSIKSGISLPVFSGYVGYAVLGYYLANFKLSIKNPKLFFSALFIAGCFITAFGTFFVMVKLNNGCLLELFYDYLSPTVMAMAISIFMLIKNKANSLTMFKSKAINFLKKTSFGIYLIHMIVIALLDGGILGYSMNYKFIHPIIGVPLTALICIIFSSLIIYTLQKIPVVNSIILPATQNSKE